MNRTLLIILAFGMIVVPGRVSAEEWCNCSVYPFRPAICAERCMSEALGRLAESEDGQKALRRIGYGKRDAKLLLGTEGDVEKILVLLEQDRSLLRPIDDELKRATSNLKDFGVHAIEY